MRVARLAAFVGRCPHGDHEAYEVVVRKGWWAGPGHGGQGRELHRFCIPVAGETETERIARALEAAAAAVRG